MVKKQLQLMAAELKDEVVPDGIELREGRKEHNYNKNIVNAAIQKALNVPRGEALKQSGRKQTTE